jgi:hypothetical protein
MKTFTFINYELELKYFYTLNKPSGYIYQLGNKYIINIIKN